MYLSFDRVVKIHCQKKTSIRMMTFSFNSCRILKSELRTESDEILGTGELNVTYSDNMLVLDVFSGTERRLFDFKGPVKTQKKSLGCGFEESGPLGPIAGVVYVRLKEHQVIVYSVVIPHETRSSHLSFFHREVSPSTCIDPNNDEGFTFGELEKCKHKMISALHNVAVTGNMVFSSPKQEPGSAVGDDSSRSNKNDSGPVATTSGGAGNATAVGANAVILPSSTFGNDGGDDSEATDLSKTLVEHGSELKVLFQQLEKSLESNTNLKSGEPCHGVSNTGNEHTHPHMHSKIPSNLDDLIKEHTEASGEQPGVSGFGSIHQHGGASAQAHAVAYKPPIDTSMDFYYTKLFDKKSPRHPTEPSDAKEKRRDKDKRKYREKKHEQNGSSLSSSSYKDKYGRSHNIDCANSSNGVPPPVKKRPGRPVVGTVKPKRAALDSRTSTSVNVDSVDKPASDEVKDAVSAIVAPLPALEEQAPNEQ
nr:nuclear protein U77.5 [Elephant endotheliotropic herpesvirus 2]